MFEIFETCKCLFIIIFNVFAENNDKYFLGDESHPNGWLILMLNPFQMDGKNIFHFFGQYFERLLFIGKLNLCLFGQSFHLIHPLKILTFNP